jgi:hypothetical protein
VNGDPFAVYVSELACLAPAFEQVEHFSASALVKRRTSALVKRRTAIRFFARTDLIPSAGNLCV